MTIEQLEKYMYQIYSKDTCYPSCRNNWNIDNPTLGHCAIVSLLVNDYFNGEIYKIKVDGISHYFNYIDNKVIDLTSKQFNKKIDYNNKIKKEREEILEDENTLLRYNILKNKLELIKNNNINDYDGKNMKIYYGLTEKESKLKILKYKDTKKYKYKGVNVSLNGLRKFIKDNKMDSLIKYYTILDSNIFDIDDNILVDKEYDMISVKIPFEFEIKNIYNLF